MPETLKLGVAKPPDVESTVLVPSKSSGSGWPAAGREPGDPTGDADNLILQLRLSPLNASTTARVFEHDERGERCRDLQHRRGVHESAGLREQMFSVYGGSLTTEPKFVTTVAAPGASGRAGGVLSSRIVMVRPTLRCYRL